MNPQPPGVLHGPRWNPSFLQPIFRLGRLHVLLSVEQKPDGHLWLHASLSISRRKMPSYDQIEAVRRAVFKPDALVLQVFPPESEFFAAEKVAHLWSRIDGPRVVPDLREVCDLTGEKGV